MYEVIPASSLWCNISATYCINCVVVCHFALSLEPAKLFRNPFLLSSRPVWTTLLCWLRHPATRCIVDKWCLSCCLSAITFHMSPMASTACTVFAATMVRGATSLPGLASFCPLVTTAHTSSQLSMAGEQSGKTMCFIGAYKVYFISGYWIV